LPVADVNTSELTHVLTSLRFVTIRKAPWVLKPKEPEALL
jgi:hypothetical protein